LEGMMRNILMKTLVDSEEEGPIIGTNEKEARI